MRVWLVTVGEPLPTDAGDRLFRTGILAELLASQGNEVVWWTSDFDHYQKRSRHSGDFRIAVGERYQIQLLHATGYSKNISLRRILNHRGVAKRFRLLSRSWPRPDVILCSLPTLELSLAATSYGREFDVPVVLDVRDLWPDVFLDLAPAALQPLARCVLSPAFKQARLACSRATAISGITKEYVDWGVAFAGRPRQELDCHFPMGYVDRRPSESAIRDAERFWAQHGVGMDGSFVACWFGMIGRHSEISTVIEAARRLVNLDHPIRFVLCGTGPDLARCRRLAQGCPNVVLPGWVNAAQIWTLLRIATVGLAPYVSIENYIRNVPNKPVEYLSAGLPIVSSLQGVLARLLAEHDCGVTYPNGRADELAQILAGLQGSPRLHEMSDHAIALYRSQFVAERVYTEMGNYLRNVAKCASPATPVETVARAA